MKADDTWGGSQAASGWGKGAEGTWAGGACRYMEGVSPAPPPHINRPIRVLGAARPPSNVCYFYQTVPSLSSTHFPSSPHVQSVTTS
jgi:hypothetical protein